MKLSDDEKNTLESRLTNLAMAHRLVEEMIRDAAGPREYGRASLALLQIECAGDFLAKAAFDNDCLTGVLHWRHLVTQYKNPAAWGVQAHDTCEPVILPRRKIG